MVEINNLTRSHVDKKLLKRVAQIVLRGENRKEAGLSVALIGSEKIKKLNKKYRGKNKITDVLAFSSGFQFPVSRLELGEVVICLQKVKKNTRKFGNSYKKELARVLIHGILHLLEYDHEETKKKAEKMEKKQQYYLSKI